MRTFTALIFCLYMLVPTFAIAQQDESCDANPRWLLVTVLAAADNFEDGNTEIALKDELRLVDRCEIDDLSYSCRRNRPQDFIGDFNAVPFG